MSDTMAQRRELQAQRLAYRVQIQSRQIERVLAGQETPAHMTGGYASPQALNFNIQTQLAQGWERLRDLTLELKSALGVPSVSWRRENGRLLLAVGQEEEPPVALLDLLTLTPDVPPLTAVLGLAENGRPVLLRFDEREVTHLLLSGVSGAGKTMLLRSMALSLALNNRQSQLQMLFVDLPLAGRRRGGTPLGPLNYLPQLLMEVIEDWETAVEALDFLVAESGYREESDEALPLLILFVENADVLLAEGGAPIREALTDLAQRGAQVGIHLVLSTQEAGTELFDANLRANLPVRLVGKQMDRQSAQAAAGCDDSNAEHLLGAGDFVVLTSRTRTYFQAAYVGDYDLHMCLQHLRRRHDLVLLAQPFVARPHLDRVGHGDEAWGKGRPSSAQQIWVFDANGKMLHEKERDSYVRRDVVAGR